ncbi:MAG TPA: hypothetical protein VGC42_11070 [Kofleriaceae bacterium]
MMFAFAPYFLLQWLRGQAFDARRKDRTWRYLAWSVAAGAANGVAAGCALWFIALFWILQLHILAIALFGVLIWPTVGPLLIRAAFVPAGWARAAYHTAMYGRVGADPEAFALCAAAWASQSGEAVAWVEAKRDQRTPLGDGEIAATAVLAANRGDVDTARALLRSLVMIVEDHPSVRELAGEWLACDAAERGAWRELFDDAAAATWPATPLTFLLEGVAARQLGAAGMPSNLELWGRWLIAPRRRATLPLVRDALAAVPPEQPRSTALTAAGAAAADGPPLIAAIAGQLAFETEPATAARLASAVGAWDAALADDATRVWLARRALELDAPLGAVDKAIADVAAAVTDDLGRLAEAAQLGAPPGGAAGPVGHGLIRRLRHGRLDHLEAGFKRWAERRHGEPLAAIDEWREFVALWTGYAAAVAAGGLDLRRLAFPQAFTQSSHMAAWLWNKRAEHVLSHAISKWLLAEALVVGDTEAIELGHRNCALAVPTRLGRIQQ